MTAFSYDPVFAGVAAIWLLAALVLAGTAWAHIFDGKRFFVTTYLAMLWWLMAVGLETVAVGFSCKILWSTLAWPAIAVMPIAWSQFVLAYLGRPTWMRHSLGKMATVVIPAAISVAALTNPWHRLLYAADTSLNSGASRIDYAHGPLFYASAVLLYPFVLAALVALARAFTVAEKRVWTILALLVFVTVTPLTANAAYILAGFTVFGLDPTSFMFAFGVIAFCWMLSTNRSMDMDSLGREVLFDAASEPVVVVDREHRPVAWNGAARRHLFFFDNKSEDATLALPFSARQFVSRLTSDPETWNGEQARVGDRVFEPRASVITSPINPGQRILGWSVTFIDITESVKTRERLQEALVDAAAASREKDEFVAIISHELRTPLTSLKGGLELALSGKLGVLSPSARASLDIAKRNGDRLQRLVDNILTSQKLEMGDLTLDAKPIDVARIIEEALEENRMFAEEKSVQLFYLDESLAPIVYGDPFGLRQVVDNLLSNAIKFSSPDSLVEATIAVVGSHVRISIKDFGLGIPEGSEELVFGRFQQVDGTDRRQVGGSGLGMHISKRLVEKMNGRIYYESEPGCGTTFHVELELKAAETKKVAN